MANSSTNNSEVQYRNTKDLSALKVEQGTVVDGKLIEAKIQRGHDNRIGGSHAWFRCGKIFGYITTNADAAIQQHGSLRAARLAGAVQYSEALGSDGNWYPQITAGTGFEVEEED